MIKNDAYLGSIFREVSKGNPITTYICQKLASTARLIDPSCPYGAVGVLTDLKDSELNPLEINNLYHLCKKDPLYLNAIIYGIYAEVFTKAYLKNSIRQGKIIPLSKMKGIIRKGAERKCKSGVMPNHRFGRYYNPKLK